MAKLDRNSINSACRLCLQVKNESYFNFIENKYFMDFHERKIGLQEMLEKHTSVKATVHDGKPQNICGECVEQLCNSFKFFAICEESDRTLEDILSEDICNDFNIDDLSGDAEHIEIVKDEEESSDGEEKTEFSVCAICDKPVNNLVLHLRSEHLLDVEKLNKCLKCNVGLPQSDNFDYSDHVSSEEHLNKKCVNCNKLFPSIKACHKHQTKCTGSQYCVMCDKSFHSFEEIFQHFNEIHKEDKSCIYGCQKDYLKWKSLLYHILVVHGHKIKCRNCMVAFDTKEEYIEHCKGNQHKNICDICNRRFDKKEKYNLHMESHEEPKHECKTCGKAYMRLINLKRHIERDHEGHRFLCQECGKSFTLKFHLEDHVKTTHVGIKKKACGFCGVVLMGEESIEEHLKLHEGNKLACFKCQISFETKEKLDMHLQTHRQIACDICGTSFLYRFQLNKHKKLDHASPFDILEKKSSNRGKPDPNKFKFCSRCNKSFETTQDYFEHAKIHKEFNCHLCDKSYMSRYVLQCHIRAHTEGYRFKCEYCGKEFLMKVTLENHIHTHTGLKQYLCNICGKEFRQRAHLAGHMNAHNDSRTFKCKFCSKTFVYHSSWLCHERIHTGEKPYVCSVCKKGFYSSTAMKKHQTTHLKSTKTRSKLEESDEEIMEQS